MTAEYGDEPRANGRTAPASLPSESQAIKPQETSSTQSPPAVRKKTRTLLVLQGHHGIDAPRAARPDEARQGRDRKQH